MSYLLHGIHHCLVRLGVHPGFPRAGIGLLLDVLGRVGRAAVAAAVLPVTSATTTAHAGVHPGVHLRHPSPHHGGLLQPLLELLLPQLLFDVETERDWTFGLLQ